MPNVTPDAKALAYRFVAFVADCFVNMPYVVRGHPNLQSYGK